jgi:hypothetical protein
MMTIPSPPLPESAVQTHPPPPVNPPPSPTNEAAVIIPNTKLLDIPALLIVVSLSKAIYFSLTLGRFLDIYVLILLIYFIPFSNGTF